MAHTFKTIGLLLFLTAGQIAYGQDSKQLALSKGQEAVKLMDNGKIDDGIKLLEEAQRLDPERYEYKYEMAYALYLKEDFKGAIKILEKYKDHKDQNERSFQLWGNSYDMLGKSDKAFEIYDAGLAKFPKSGMLYLEKGNVHWNKKEYEKALPYYEKGIEVAPMFASNYYRATRIYCNSTEEVWGMIYGEIFMNLERNTKRTAEMSKLLYDTYLREIKRTGDNSFSVSFSKNAALSAKSAESGKLPYGIGVYEPTLVLSMLSAKSIDMNSLDAIRSSFIDIYFQNENGKTYPNALFSYQKRIKEAGHLEAYNHWILMKGDEAAFDKWQSENIDKWDIFTTWFGQNPLKLNDANKFYRDQY